MYQIRKTNDRLISIIANGTFVDIDGKNLKYRVKVTLPNCLDEWLLSNIKNRYIAETILAGKEIRTVGNKESEFTNNDYLRFDKIKSVVLEYNTLKELDVRPSFYGKSILDFSFAEIQDFAVAFGLHEIRASGEINTLIQDAVKAYFRRIEGFKEKDLLKLRFMKYDAKRKKYFIVFDDKDKKQLVINKRIDIDYREFEENDRAMMEEKEQLDSFLSSQRIEEEVEVGEETEEIQEEKKTKTKKVVEI